MTEEERKAHSERMKLCWLKRRAKTQGYQQSPIIGVDVGQAPTEKPEKATVSISVKSADPWQELPWNEAKAKLAKLKADYEHALDVMSRRSETAPKVRTCWTALHHKDLADFPGMKTAYAKCSKTFKDADQKFVDNCHIDPNTGMVDPVFCCGTLCIALYHTYKSQMRYKGLGGKP
jgi:hypothetical protein